jgi:hypothetical protein
VTRPSFSNCVIREVHLMITGEACEAGAAAGHTDRLLDYPTPRTIAIEQPSASLSKAPLVTRWSQKIRKTSERTGQAWSTSTGQFAF